jgi:hypothetical protein
MWGWCRGWVAMGIGVSVGCAESGWVVLEGVGEVRCGWAILRRDNRNNAATIQ